MKKTNMSHDSVFSTAKRIAVISVVLYVVSKQVIFFTFIDIKYWLPRGLVNAAMIIMVLLITRNKKLPSRHMSWMVPVSFIFLEIIGSVLTDGDQMVYSVLVACALLSLLFADVFGLAVTTITSSAGVAFCLLFGFNLYGEVHPFEYNLFHFLGMLVVNGIIFSIGKYTIGTISRIRQEKELVSAKIEQIVNNLPKGMVYQHLNNSPEYTLTFVSKGSKELTGYTPEELIGGKNKFMEMVHPDDMKDILNKTAQTLDIGLPCEITYRIIMQDGKIKWILDRMNILEEGADPSSRIVDGYMFDITDQKQLEIAELSELMLDTSPICIQLIDRNHQTVGCNAAAVNLYGFKEKQEYFERFSKDCSPEYQPDGQRSDEKAAKQISKAFYEGRCVFDWMHQMPDGTPIPAEITLVRMNHKDDYVVVAHTRDLRDIVKLEAEAQKIYYDALTGIYNRRFFDENLIRLSKTLSRSRGSLGLMMIDIDFFKRYNDTYGHSEGDNCLKIVAETLSESITRKDDFIARYGGEEFAVVLPNTDEVGAIVIAEKMIENIQKQGIPHETSDAASYVTVSIGVATGRVEHTQNGRDFLKRADEMLYKSKQSGRNRYSLSKK